MNKLGSYKNVDGLEPASGMLQLAKDKGLYKKYMEQFFHLNSGLAQSKLATDFSLTGNSRSYSDE